MILGITGKSGSGKHTVAKYFQQRDWKILDADKIAHKLYRPYLRIWRDVVDRFGEGILKTNDIINRQKLRKIVFAGTPESNQALKDLNGIVHPELKRYIKDEVYFQKKRKKNTIVVAALWKELGLPNVCDKVLLIKAGDALAFERINKRDGIDFEMYEAYTQNQTNLPKADFTVKNEGTFQELYKKLNKIISEL